MLERKQLHDYQVADSQFIIDQKRAFLMLGLGAGKTITTLTAIADLLAISEVTKVLIVAPLRVAQSVWAQETANWSHTKDLRCSLVLGPLAKRVDALSTDADIYVINRENIPWLLTQYTVRTWPFDMVVIDESSSFKNASSKRFKALKKIAPLTDYWVNLSATPSPNTLLELWPQCYFIDSGNALGKTMSNYRNRFFTSDYMGYKWEPKEGVKDTIHNAITPYTVSRESIAKHEPVSIRISVDLPKKAREQYEELRKHFLLEVENETIEAVNAAVLANKLLQICAGAIYTEDDYEELHAEKLDALAELIEQNPNENIFLAYNFKSDAQRITERFPQAVKLDGPQTINDWNKGKIKLLIAHPASCGHGLNLQAGGSLIVWLGLTWSLELYLQLNGRIARQGQQNQVRLVHIVANNTIEDRVLETLNNKDANQRETLEFFKKVIA